MRSRLLRISVRARFTVLYGGLFFLSGMLLLAINYGLVRANLPVAQAPAFAGQAPSPGGGIEITNPDLGAVTSLPTPDQASGDTVQLGVAEYRSSVLRTLLVQSTVAIVLTAVLALVLGWLAARRVLGPVRDITATARRLSADTLGKRRLARAGPRDELTELADTIDQMLDRLAASFDSQRRFVANASHELRTPLAAQRTLVEVAMSAADADPRLRHLGDRLLTLNQRSEQLIEGLLVLARSDRGLPARTPIRLDDLVDQVLTQQRADADAAGVTVRADLLPRTVAGDRVLLERLVTNLVQNAIRYNTPGGQVCVRVADAPALEIANTGPVVPDDEVARLFEPFHRLGGERTGSQRGAGLGLSIVASVATAHGGTATAHPRAGGGLVVAVSLPPPVQPPAAAGRP